MDITTSELCDTFQRYFLCCKRIFSLPWQTINHPLCLKYPSSLQYRRLFLLELIKKQESTGDEPLDDLYSALAEVLNSEETTVCYKSYLFPSGITVTLQENSAIISEGTTGLVTWDAALILAEWAFENVDLFKNRTILEFGSGIGLTGLAICKGCFPKRYTFSDFHQKVLQQLRENIQLNGFVLGAEQDKLVKTEIVKDLDTPQLLVKNLDWESITEEHLSQLESDVVIASDVVYDPEIVSSFTNVLHTILQKNDEKGPDIFVASTIRNLETHALFQAKLEDAGLKWQILADQKKSMFASETSCTVQIDLP
ncbi:protein-lysine N-methyltransferase EEF2KMT [Gastrophryne carolinensis]